MNLIHKRFVKSGNVIEIYEYEKPVLEGYQNKNVSLGRQGSATDDEKKENRGKVLNRAKRDLRRKINANSGELKKFITLTFKENETNLDYCNYEFKKFIERLKYWNKRVKGKPLKYVCVVEFQKRGAVHYHLLANLKYISNDDLKRLWGNGFVKINRVDRVDNVGAYVVKYMQKDMSDKRLEGRKSYFTSRNLKKPLEYTEIKKVDEIAAHLLEGIKPCYETSFDNDYTGKVVYRQYNLKRE